jgi:hypothetical protein
MLVSHGRVAGSVGHVGDEVECDPDGRGGTHSL